MQRRKKQNMIISGTALAGIALILSALWIVSKDYRFSKYRNDRQGFSIKYPAAWSYEEGTNDAAVIFFSPVENELDFFKESLNVVVQDISGNPMDLAEYSEIAIDQMEAVFGDNMIIFESGLTNIAKQDGYKLVFLGKGLEADMKFMNVWLIKGVTSYQLTYTSLESQYDRYLPKVKSMIKSFRVD